MTLLGCSILHYCVKTLVYKTCILNVRGSNELYVVNGLLQCEVSFLARRPELRLISGHDTELEYRRFASLFELTKCQQWSNVSQRVKEYQFFWVYLGNFSV